MISKTYAALGVLAVVLYACSPNLGDAPFFCNNGTPECPAGYFCDKSGPSPICVREGAKLDSGVTPDTGPIPDFQIADMRIDSGPQPDLPVSAFNLKITEIMANPEAVADNDGEYFEVFNGGTSAVDLSGWTIRDDDSDSHVITGSLLIMPNQFLVFAKNGNFSQNGSVNADYVFDNFNIANSDDEIILQDPSGAEVAAVRYSAAAGFTIPAGASISILNPFNDPNIATSWCEEPNPWPQSVGDRGSPGMSPGC